MWDGLWERYGRRPKAYPKGCILPPPVGSKRPENCPVDSFQRRTGGSPEHVEGSVLQQVPKLFIFHCSLFIYSFIPSFSFGHSSQTRLLSPKTPNGEDASTPPLQQIISLFPSPVKNTGSTSLLGLLVLFSFIIMILNPYS